MNRRQFLKAIGLGGAAALIGAATGKPRTEQRAEPTAEPTAEPKVLSQVDVMTYDKNGKVKSWNRKVAYDVVVIDDIDCAVRKSLDHLRGASRQ